MVAGGSRVPSKGTAQPDVSIDVIISDLSAETDREGIWGVLSSFRAEDGQNIGGVKQSDFCHEP